jgi:acetyl esterase/lipase
VSVKAGLPQTYFFRIARGATDILQFGHPQFIPELEILKSSIAVLLLSLFTFVCPAIAAGDAAKGRASAQRATSAPIDPAAAFPPKMQAFALYGDDPIPNSKPTGDEESGADSGYIRNVSRPQVHVYLPAKMRATGASIVIVPGGGYGGLTFEWEGKQQAQFFVDHGIAAFIVKYRIPSDKTMVDKSIGPLQDAQQAMRFVRQRASEWNLDPERVGVIGFSAGGHLASTLATHLDKVHVPNPDRVDVRPDFTILIYPVISMQSDIAHSGSREALLGGAPSEELVRKFSSDLQVSERTPPTLILHATDDPTVDVENSIRYYQALRHTGVPVEMRLFEKGQHGFFLMPRDRWQSTIMEWLTSNGWLHPRVGAASKQ